MDITIVTGSRDSGKTTWCTRAYPSAHGVIAVKVYSEGLHLGYDAVRPCTGETVPILRTVDSAHIGQAGTIGKFAIINAGFDAANRWILNNRAESTLIIDEIGKLELRGDGYAPALETTLNSRRSGQIVLIVRSTYIDDVKRRFCLPDTVEIIDIGRGSPKSNQSVDAGPIPGIE